MSGFKNINIGDGANLDAFSRVRVSNSVTLFDSQLTYGLNPLIYEQKVTGTGATLAHDATNRCALMTFASTPTGGTSYMQSYEYVPYQPSKSQLIFVTFNMREHITDCLKFAGYGDSTNGIFLESNGTDFQVKIYSGTSVGNQVATQANWNLDRMNGSGRSGKTVDVSKTQILVIDFQALYVGRVRIGFDIDGVIYYVHEFLHANNVNDPYFQTANLPVRCGMTCTGTVSTTMNFICAAVCSEGGRDETFGYEFAAEASTTAASGARTHMISLRPKTTFNSIVNRMSIGFIEVNLLVTGTNPILWELCIGQALTTPTYTDVNTTYSGSENATGETLSGTPAIIIDSGYVVDADKGSGSSGVNLTNKYPITLDQLGAIRELGTLTLLVTGIGGASACRASIKFKENR